MLGILYNFIVQESGDFTEKSREMETIIREKVKTLNVDGTQREDVKALMYDFLGIAQEVYFKLVSSMASGSWWRYGRDMSRSKSDTGGRYQAPKHRNTK